MGPKRLALALATGFVVMGVLSHILRVAWAVPIYSRYELLWSLSAVSARATAAIAMGQLLFLLVFFRVYSDRQAVSGRHWWRRGTRYGVTMTLLMVVPAVCVQSVLYPVPLRLIAVWTATGGLELIALALVVAWFESRQPLSTSHTPPGPATTPPWPGLDVSIIQSIDREVVEAFGRLIPQLSKSAPPPSREVLNEILRSPSNTIFVARSPSGAIVGSLTLVTFRIPTGVRAWIEDVVVDKEARGHGVGEALSRAALARAAQQGARTVELTSSPSREAANRLYQRLGFAPRLTNVYRYDNLQGSAAGTQVPGFLSGAPHTS